MLPYIGRLQDEKGMCDYFKQPVFLPGKMKMPRVAFDGVIMLKPGLVLPVGIIIGPVPVIGVVAIEKMIVYKMQETEVIEPVEHLIAHPPFVNAIFTYIDDIHELTDKPHGPVEPG